MMNNMKKMMVVLLTVALLLMAMPVLAEEAAPEVQSSIVDTQKLDARWGLPVSTGASSSSWAISLLTVLLSASSNSPSSSLVQGVSGADCVPLRMTMQAYPARARDGLNLLYSTPSRDLKSVSAQAAAGVQNWAPLSFSSSFIASETSYSV